MKQSDLLVGEDVLNTYLKRVLARLTSCKRLTDCLPKRSLVTISPPETAGYQVGRLYGRTCQYLRGSISWECRGA